MRLILLLALALLPAAPHPAAAQVTVSPVRDLGFGPVIAGVTSYVPPSDPVQSGQFRVIAPLLTRVRFRFTLPTRLDGPAGASMPIVFANNDAITLGAGPVGIPVSFNPKSSRTQVITSTTTQVFIGGTVLPAATQRPGSYTGTITLTVNIL